MKKTLLTALSIVLMLFAFASCDNNSGNPGFGGDTQQVANQLKPADLVKDVLKSGAKGVDVVYELIPASSTTSSVKVAEQYTLKVTVTFTGYETAAGTITDGVIVYMIPGTVDNGRFSATGSCTITTEEELVVETEEGNVPVEINDSKATVTVTATVDADNNVDKNNVTTTVTVSAEIETTVDGDSVKTPEETKPEPAPETVKVTLSFGAEESTVSTLDKGSEYTFSAPSEEQIPEGKVFISWMNGDSEYFAGDKLNINEDITFTALFVDEGVRIQIGDQSYDTLASAVDAAEDGDVIDIYASMDGSGVKFESNKFNDNGLTINLHDKEYCVIDPTVGSTGTETNAFQLLRDNKITFKNGTVSTSTASAKILFQNYCDLILDNMVVTAGPATQYVASNNFGSLTMRNGTVLNARSGYCAFDVYYLLSTSYAAGVWVKIEDDSVVINGKVEYGHSGSATFEDFVAKTALIVPAGYESKLPQISTDYTYEWVDDTSNDGYKKVQFQGN